MDFNLRGWGGRFCIPFVIIINVRIVNQLSVGEEGKEMASEVVMLQFGEGVRG